MFVRRMRGKVGPASARVLMRAGMAALLSTTMLATDMRSAAALEIFGIRLWGSAKDEDAGIVDPLRYSVTFSVVDADDDLREALEKASLLKSEEKRPVSGSLGLLAKARNDRERLVAALFSKARYDGIVNITIAGKRFDYLEPDAVFTGPQPIPVTVTI